MQDPIAMAERMMHEHQLPSSIDLKDEILSPECGMEKIERLQSIMFKMPQETRLETSHYFVPGMYCRKLYRPAGTVIVGKVHKKSHFFMCASGELIVIHEGGTRTLKAGDVIECQPGTKRVTFAVVDSVGITIHKTDKTCLDDIEEELIEHDERALFDSGNNLKNILE